MPSIYLETRKDAGDSNNTSFSVRPSVGFTARPAISSIAVEHSYASDESSASNPQQPTKSEMRPAAEVFGFLLEKRRPSNSMPISVEPTSAVLPVTRGVNLPVNHTQTTPATAMNSKQSPSPVGQPTVTATATRASRIPRGRRSLQLPGDFTTLNSETQLLTTPSTEPASTLIPTYNCNILRSATNTTERAHVATSHLTSNSERDVTSALAPKRSARRRSASCGPSRLIPSSWSALPDTTGTAHPKGLKSNDGKENTSIPVSAAKNVGLCTFSPFSFSAVVGSHTST